MNVIELPILGSVYTRYRGSPQAGLRFVLGRKSKQRPNAMRWRGSSTYGFATLVHKIDKESRHNKQGGMVAESCVSRCHLWDAMAADLRVDVDFHRIQPVPFLQ
jgi:hypothetical protein